LLKYFEQKNINALKPYARVIKQAGSISIRARYADKIELKTLSRFKLVRGTYKMNR
jgi:hypothetical protein